MGKRTARGKKQTLAEGGDSHESADPLVSEVTLLLDKLCIDEALASTTKGPGESPTMQDLVMQCEEMKKYFIADGVSAEVGAATGSVGGSRGRGLVTTRAFRQGEILVCEDPLLVAPQTLATLGGVKDAAGFDAKTARQAYASLSKMQRRLLLSFEARMNELPTSLAELVSADPSLEGPLRLARAMKINAHDYPSGNQAALYVLVARANHSCDPTCGLAAAPGGRLLFYALRDMAVGEEVDYSYLGGHFTLKDAHSRRDQLQRAKLFDCKCQRCLLGDPSPSVPCAADRCAGFLQLEGDVQNSKCWKCNVCSTTEEANSDRFGRYRRLEPMLAAKVLALEAKWGDPSKDVTKYINDWEALAKTARQMLGTRHHIYGRACFFALQALNTGHCMSIGGVGAARHAAGIDLYALPLARYLRECCPLGVQRVALEPVGMALVKLFELAEYRNLVASTVQQVGPHELRTCLYSDTLNAALGRVVALQPGS